MDFHKFIKCLFHLKHIIRDLDDAFEIAMGKKVYFIDNELDTLDGAYYWDHTSLDS